MASRNGDAGTPHPKRLLIIHNPTAGRSWGWFFRDVATALAGLGCDLTIQTTTQRGDAEDFARLADYVTFDAVVAAGGDGTIGEVVNGLLSRDAESPIVPLGFIPLGTANVLAAEIGLPTNAEALARTITAGSRLRCYPGVANGRAFMMMAGVGFDAHVVNTVSASLKNRIGKGAYVWAAIRELLRRDSGRYDVIVEGRTMSAASVVVGKGRFYGGRYICTPDARLDKPSFQICLFKRSGAWASIRYILGLMRGALPRLKDVVLIETDHVRIEGRFGDPVQGDGDIFTSLPLDIRIADKSIDLLAPV